MDTIKVVYSPSNIRMSQKQNQYTSDVYPWSVTPYLHCSLPSPLTHNNTFILSINNLPDTLTGLAQLPHIIPRIRLEQPHPAIIPARNEEMLVELQGRDGRVVCGDAVESGECREGEGDDASVGSTCRENGGGELELANESRVALKQSDTFTSVDVPNPYSRIQPARCNPHSVKRDRVDLVKVTLENMQTLPSVHVPQPTGCIVTPADDPVAADIQTPDALRVSLQHT